MFFTLSLDVKLLGSSIIETIKAAIYEGLKSLKASSFIISIITKENRESIYLAAFPFSVKTPFSIYF